MRDIYVVEYSYNSRIYAFDEYYVIVGEDYIYRSNSRSYYIGSERAMIYRKSYDIDYIDEGSITIIRRTNISRGIRVTYIPPTPVAYRRLREIHGYKL